MATYNPYMQEYISISDNIDEDISYLRINVYDSISIVEDIEILQEPLGAIKSDSISIAESDTREISTQFVLVTDSISIAEDIEIIQEPLGLLTNDSISIADTQPLEIPRLDLSTNNSITIAESQTPILPRLDISTSDSPSIAESQSLIIPILYESLSEAITIAEYPYWGLSPIPLSTNNSITIAEYPYWGLSPIPLSTNNSITIAEYINPAILILLSMSDSITIAEWEKEDIWHIWADLYINIIEYIAVTDSETPTVFCYYYGYDSVTIAESLAYGLSLIVLSTSDSISISDTEQETVLPLVVYDNIYIRDLYVKAIADADVGTGALGDTIAATQLVLASATRTAGTATSNSFKVRSALFIRWYVNVTAEVGSSTLDIIIQTSPDNSVWYDAVTIDQISATGQYTDTLTEPGIYVRAKCTVAGTSFTYAIKMTKHMPIRRFERRRPRRRSLARK